MNWLITGGCGFIGVNLVERILRDDNSAYIRVIDNLQSGRKEMLGNVCEYKEVNQMYIEPGAVHLYLEDIKNPFVAMDACKDINLVVHLAANTGVPVSVRYPIEDCYTNVLGTINYLEAARRNNVSRFIFASTSAASGGYDPPFHEQLFPRPIAPYGASKSAGESYCHVYTSAYNLPTIALRFSNVYGPHSINKEAQLIPNFIMRSINGSGLQVFGDGSQTRDYCYVSDLMDAIMTAVSRPSHIVGGQVIQIATNIETDVKSVALMIFESLKKYGIDDYKVQYTSERPGDLQRNYSDISKARDLLGWSNKVSISIGISKTVDWFIKNYRR